MAAFRARLVVLVLATVMLGPLIATAPAYASTSELVELPDLVGEPLNVALKPIKALDLKSKVDADGRAVWVKKNWIVIEQSPAGGALVKPGSKVTLVVIKKSEVVSEGTALGACRAWAKTDPELAYGVEFPALDFVTVKRDLGWAIDADAWVTTSTDGRVAARVYCEVAGTNKKPSVDEYEVTAR